MSKMCNLYQNNYNMIKWIIELKLLEKISFVLSVFTRKFNANNRKMLRIFLINLLNFIDIFAFKEIKFDYEQQKNYKL